MNDEETMVEIVSRLERAVRRLETIVDGDSDLGIPGVKFRIGDLERRVGHLEKARPNLTLWVLAFLLFVASFSLTMDEVRTVAELSSAVAWSLGVALLCGSLALFVYAFGWVDWFRK